MSNDVSISLRPDHSTFSVRSFRVLLTITLSNKIVPSIQPQSNVKGCLNGIITVEFKGDQVSRAAIFLSLELQEKQDTVNRVVSSIVSLKIKFLGRILV